MPDLDQTQPETNPLRRIDREDLQETEGVPLPLPNEIVGPGRGRSDIAALTGGLGSTGSPLTRALTANGDERAVLWRISTVLLALLVARVFDGPFPWKLLACVALVGGGEALRLGLPRVERARFEAARERSRQKVLASRYRHATDSALSRSDVRDSHDGREGRGLSRPPE